MLPRSLLLRHPALRSTYVCSLYRFLLKNLHLYPDQIVKNNLKPLISSQFHLHSQDFLYRKYSKSIKQAEVLSNYFRDLTGNRSEQM